MPFLVSIVLVVLGHLVRRTVEESPVFLEMRSTATRAKLPVATLWRRHGVLVVLAALVFAVSAVTWGVFTVLSGAMADRVGRRRTMVVGYVAVAVLAFPMFALVASGSAWLLTLGLVLFTVGRPGIDLSVGNEEEQQGATLLSRRRTPEPAR